MSYFEKYEFGTKISGICDSLTPSGINYDETGVEWLTAVSHERYPRFVDDTNAGKWIIEFDRNNIDAAWKKVLNKIRKYDPRTAGKPVIYAGRLFAETRAIFFGERKLFANTRSWLDGNGILFADTWALIKGKKPLFANTRTFFGGLTQAKLKPIEQASSKNMALPMHT